MTEILLPPSSAKVRNMQLTSSINLYDVVCRGGYFLLTLINNLPGVNYLLYVWGQHSQYCDLMRLDILGAESWRWWDFLYHCRLALGPTQPPVQLVLGLLRRKVARECCLPPTTPSSTEVRKSLELYHYSPSGPSWSALGWIYLFSLPGAFIPDIFLSGK